MKIPQKFDVSSFIGGDKCLIPPHQGVCDTPLHLFDQIKTYNHKILPRKITVSSYLAGEQYLFDRCQPNDGAEWLWMDFFELSGFGIDDETTDDDVFGHEGMGLNGGHRLSDRLGGVFESFEPGVEIDAALANRVEGMVGDAASQHFVMKMSVTHVASTTMRMGHYHNFAHMEFVNGDNETAHGRVEGRNDQATGIFYDFGITILEAESRR